METETRNAAIFLVGLIVFMFCAYIAAQALQSGGGLSGTFNFR